MKLILATIPVLEKKIEIEYLPSLWLHTFTKHCCHLGLQFIVFLSGFETILEMLQLQYVWPATTSWKTWNFHNLFVKSWGVALDRLEYKSDSNIPRFLHNFRSFSVKNPGRSQAEKLLKIAKTVWKTIKQGEIFAGTWNGKVAIMTQVGECFCRTYLILKLKHLMNEMETLDCYQEFLATFVELQEYWDFWENQ